MLSNRVKQCRTARHLTVRELAEKAGISKDTVRFLERNRRANVHWRTMRAIAGAMELPVSSVFIMGKSKDIQEE